MSVRCTRLKYHIENDNDNNEHHQIAKTTRILIPEDTTTYYVSNFKAVDLHIDNITYCTICDANLISPQTPVKEVTLQF